MLFIHPQVEGFCASFRFAQMSFQSGIVFSLFDHWLSPITFFLFSQNSDMPTLIFLDLSSRSFLFLCTYSFVFSRGLESHIPICFCSPHIPNSAGSLLLQLGRQFNVQKIFFMYPELLVLQILAYSGYVVICLLKQLDCTEHVRHF